MLITPFYDRIEPLLVQTALFTPKGLWRVLYWYGLYPVHGLLVASLVAAGARQRPLSPSEGGHAW